MKYLSVCSGIEAATMAWHQLGWQPVAFSEIEPFPSAVLDHHYPTIPNLGDMTRYEEWNIEPGSIDLLCGGTPCQSFSVAGLRKGMADPRGNLALVFLGILNRLRPRWVVWENVRGVLSADEGRAFGSFIGGLEELGYGWAYRTYDAQYFDVAQRRERVFVVGYLGDWRRAAAVLFEPESLRGNTPPSREAIQGTARNATGGAAASRERPIVIDRAAFNQGENALYEPHVEASETMDTLVARGPHAVGYRMEAFGQYADDDCASTMKARDYKDATDLVTSIHGTQGPDINDECVSTLGRNSGQENAVVIPIHDQATRHAGKNGDKTAGKGNGLGIGKDGAPANPLTAGDRHAVAVFEPRVARNGRGAPSDVVPPLKAQNGQTGKGDGAPCVFADNMRVRRLTPIECERLMGFPDNFTRIPWRNKPAEECPDGPRYKALGNSWAVPCAVSIGEAINELEQLKGNEHE
tara:strand:- start:3168 stop:4565 length:1398 start_codon:yes stop_codon:yes gene_type:complete